MPTRVVGKRRRRSTRHRRRHGVVPEVGVRRQPAEEDAVEPAEPEEGPERAALRVDVVVRAVGPAGADLPHRADADRADQDLLEDLTSLLLADGWHALGGRVTGGTEDFRPAL